MQNFDSVHPLGAILGAPSHTKLGLAIPLFKMIEWTNEKRRQTERHTLKYSKIFCKFWDEITIPLLKIQLYVLISF